MMKSLLLILSVTVMTGCGRPARPGVQHQTDLMVGNLHASHFEGDELNAGGRATIDAIRGNRPAVLVIHLTRATDRQVFVRRAKDVKIYAKHRGLVEAQVRFDSTYDEPPAAVFDPLETTTACVADDNR